MSRTPNQPPQKTGCPIHRVVCDGWDVNIRPPLPPLSLRLTPVILSSAQNLRICFSGHHQSIPRLREYTSALRRETTARLRARIHPCHNNESRSPASAAEVRFEEIESETAARRKRAAAKTHASEARHGYPIRGRKMKCGPTSPADLFDRFVISDGQVICRLHCIRTHPRREYQCVVFMAHKIVSDAFSYLVEHIGAVAICHWFSGTISTV
jgi:hypothetical protein